MKDMTINEDFVLVPKCVFEPLQRWYNCTKVIERTVIKYRPEKKHTMMLPKLKKAPSMLLPPTPTLFSKASGDSLYELEVYPKFIYYERITDKGERPHRKAIVNQKVDTSYLKKLKLDKIPFFELYISRKATFE